VKHDNIIGGMEYRQEKNQIRPEEKQDESTDTKMDQTHFAACDFRIAGSDDCHGK
jgi:hypothetical protein